MAEEIRQTHLEDGKKVLEKEIKEKKQGVFSSLFFVLGKERVIEAECTETNTTQT